MTSLAASLGLGRTPAADFLLALAIYFAAQALLRVFLAPSVGLDEAEILITAQFPGWGQGSQPPLYNWLQIAAFQLLGVNVWALALLKNLLLFSIFAFSFLSARIVLRDEVQAATATAALFLVPQIGWESQRALTHTVIVVAAAAMTLYVLLRVLRHGCTGDYLWLGLSLGLGFLSKYNFGLGAAAMLLAAASRRDLRFRILSGRMLLTLAVAVLVVLPHLMWVSDNMSSALARTSKFAAGRDAAFTPWPIVAVLLGAFEYAALVAGVFAGFWFWARRHLNAAVPARGQADLRSVVLRVIPIGLALLATGALLSGATNFKDRWMGPLMFVLPLVLTMLVPLPRPLEQRLRNLCLAAGLGAMLALGVFYQTSLATIPAYANRPLQDIAAAIRQAGFTEGTLIASDTALAGGLKAEFPGSLVLEPQYGRLAEGPHAGPLMLVWTGQAEAPPAKVAKLYREICGQLPQLRPFPVRGSYQHGGPGFSIMAARLDPCR